MFLLTPSPEEESRSTLQKVVFVSKYNRAYKAFVIRQCQAQFTFLRILEN
jgi:hypothetical protein